MAKTKTDEKIYFIKTTSSTITNSTALTTAIGNDANTSIVANTNNNFLSIAGTTFIPANPKFTDTTYSLVVEEDETDDELVNISLVAD